MIENQYFTATNDYTVIKTSTGVFAVVDHNTGEVIRVHASRADAIFDADVRSEYHSRTKNHVKGELKWSKFSDACKTMMTSLGT